MQRPSPPTVPARRGRLARLVAVATAGVAALNLAGCGAVRTGTPATAPARADTPYAGAPVRVAGLRVPARATATDVELARRGGFVRRFWPGVNLGSTIPGHFPGETASSRADYRRWLRGMGELGARLVRVYTILPPRFYEELATYNRAHPAAPIRLVQGVWIPEEEFMESRDLYSDAVTDGFRAEIARAVDVVHGDAHFPDVPGHAGGRYTADVSRWLLAWSIGVEWDPSAVAASDRRNAGVEPFRGRFLRATADATPTESWIASMLDLVATLEAARGWSRPLTFTNWLTTDPLHHPSEPLEQEDMISIDAMHVRATAAWPGGFFASYHAYPYYPEFIRHEPAYRRGRDPSGRVDSYAGMLAELRAHHRGQAVMITEFGVPTGAGVAHRGPQGRDQGDHSEQEAGRLEAGMLAAIEREGYAGGVVFEYVDEWFKLTWNTFALEVPERRPLWRNTLTNEEHFGLVATEAGVRPTVTLDGRDGEWARARARRVAGPAGAVRDVTAAHDAEYLYLRVRTSRPEAWRTEPVRIGFSVRPGGNGGLPGARDAGDAAEIALTVGRSGASLRWASWVDPNLFQYGAAHGYVPAPERLLQPGSGEWVEPRLILNRPMLIPGTGVERPAEWAGYGALRAGDEREDVRNMVDGKGRVLEIRLPWALLTFMDPSSHSIWDPQPDGTVRAQVTSSIDVTLAAGGDVARGRYSWDGWDVVQWHERRKAGWGAVRAAFLRSAAAPR